METVLGRRVGCVRERDSGPRDTSIVVTERVHQFTFGEQEEGWDLAWTWPGPGRSHRFRARHLDRASRCASMRRHPAFLWSETQIRHPIAVGRKVGDDRAWTVVRPMLPRTIHLGLWRHLTPVESAEYGHSIPRKSTRNDDRTKGIIPSQFIHPSAAGDSADIVLPPSRT